MGSQKTRLLTLNNIVWEVLVMCEKKRLIICFTDYFSKKTLISWHVGLEQKFLSSKGSIFRKVLAFFRKPDVVFISSNSI